MIYVHNQAKRNFLWDLFLRLVPIIKIAECILAVIVSFRMVLQNLTLWLFLDKKKHLRNLILRFWGKITIFHSLLSNGYCWKFLSNTEHMWCVARFGTICMIWKTWKTSMEDCYLNSKSSTPSWVLCTLIAWRISYEYVTQVDLGPC